MPHLSPELAQDSPDVFKEELIDGLTRRSAYGGQLWRAVESAGLVGIETLHLDPSTWNSRANAQQGHIHLGVQPMPEQTRTQLVFDDHSIDYEDEVTLRLLHETSHLYEARQIRAGSDTIQALLKMAREVRSANQNLGLSAIGSLPFYGPEMKFREDAVELMAQYAYSPQYLRGLMSHIGNPASESMLQKVGIVAVVPGQEDHLYSLVEDAVQEGIAA